MFSLICPYMDPNFLWIQRRAFGLLYSLVREMEQWGECLACWHQLSCCWMVTTPCNLPPPRDLRSGSTPKFPAKCHQSNSIQNPFLPRLLGNSLLSLPSHFSSSSPPLLSKDLLPHLITGFLGLWPLWRLREGTMRRKIPFCSPLSTSSSFFPPWGLNHLWREKRRDAASCLPSHHSRKREQESWPLFPDILSTSSWQKAEE